MNRVLFMNKEILIAGLCSLCTLSGLSAQTVVEEARSTLSELVQTKKDIIESKSAWETDREILKATIKSLNDELEMLETRIEESEKQRAESVDIRERLNETNAVLKSQLDGFVEIVTGFEQKLISLLPYLPEPLLDEIGKLTDKLPRDGKSGLDAPRRALIVLGILQEIDKFQTSVTTHKLLLEIDAEEEKEYSVMFYGLGTAFFVDEDLTIAGFGSPSPEGWVWTSNNLLAERIFDAIEIAERKKLAEFIPLPVTIQ
ncbi:MAG: DUF3450 family protein [Verrucomicrobiota bacterium]